MSFRSGDRAETMGVVLLQGTCAVARIPREEDFGLADALATLLRRDGRFVFAEDSFLVQFKSRTEKVIRYEGPAFDELRAQDLSVLVGQVNLRTSTIELCTLGPVLAHPNVNDARSLTVYLKTPRKQPLGLRDDVLHARLGPPILRWSVADVENATVMQNAYAVLKAHLALERWNRQHRPAGTSRQIRWETNDMPTAAGEMLLMNPAREREALSQVVPGIRALAARAHTHAELREPVTGIMRWLARQGVDADPSAVLLTMLGVLSRQDKMRQVLSTNASAEVAMTFEVVSAGPDFLNFWLYDFTVAEKGSSSRHHGTLAALRAQGFEVDVAVDGTVAEVTVGVTDGWLAARHLEALSDQPTDGVFLFRRRQPPT